MAGDFIVTTLPAASCDAAIGTRRVVAVGRLTGLGGELLEAAVAGVFSGAAANRPRQVWMDLSAVTAVEPAGVDGVTAACGIAWSHGADVTIHWSHWTGCC